MKLTKEQLKRIIKEELDTLTTEDQTLQEGEQEDILKAAKELQDSRAMDPVFAAMAKDPEVGDLLKKLSGQTNEEVLGMTGSSSAGMTMMGMIAGAPSASAFMASAGGKLLMAKAAAAMGVSAATLGTAAVGFLAPIAIGFILDVAANKAMKK